MFKNVLFYITSLKWRLSQHCSSHHHIQLYEEHPFVNISQCISECFTECNMKGTFLAKTSFMLGFSLM